jgi:hypothetical protein
MSASTFTAEIERRINRQRQELLAMSMQTLTDECWRAFRGIPNYAAGREAIVEEIVEARRKAAFG